MMQQSEGETACPHKCKETMSDDEDEEFQFSNLMDQLGARKILDDESDVKQLWLQLRKDKPHLLASFEELLVRFFSQLQEANSEKNELECALKKKAAAYHEEIEQLYEEMEQQIKKEKEQFLLKDTERYQSYSKELECRLLSKEQELEHLVQNQKMLEQQCEELLSGKEETKIENTKLKLTNQELQRDLERTCHELRLAQQQLQLLQEEASRVHEEKEMKVYQLTETLQREKSGLLKQMNFLRKRNKHLKDEGDMFLQKCKTSVPEASWKQRSGSVIGKYIESKIVPYRHASEGDDIFSNSKRRISAELNEVLSVESGAGATGELSKASHLQRIISIEEDHLPQLLDRLVDKQMNRWTGEDENTSEMKLDKKTTEQSMEHSLPSVREQPIEKEMLSNLAFKTQHIGPTTGFMEQMDTNICSYLKKERINSAPDHLFKIIFVGNSGVGKTSFLRRFCEDRFFPGTAATVGVDYNVKTIAVDNTQVVLQLWDTAGQERYQSVTKQFFRKADGVIVMYDITAKDTFTAVKHWLISIKEANGENVPVLLLGNKTDNEKEREVPTEMGEHLAKDYNLIFCECSAYSGYNTKMSVLCLASGLQPDPITPTKELMRLIKSPRNLKEQEDKVKEKTIELQSDRNKRSCCIRP